MPGAEIAPETLHRTNTPPPPYTERQPKENRNKAFSTFSDTMSDSIAKHEKIIEDGNFKTYGYKSKKEVESACEALKKQRDKVDSARKRVMKRSDSKLSMLRDALTFLTRIISNLFHLHSVKPVQTMDDIDKIIQKNLQIA